MNIVLTQSGWALPAGRLPNPDGSIDEPGPTLSASTKKGWQNEDDVTEAVCAAVLAPSIHLLSRWEGAVNCFRSP